MTLSAQVEEQILVELKKISRVVTLMATKDLQQVDKIRTLSDLGMQPKEIADLIGTTPNTVSVRLSGMRKAKAAIRPRQEDES